MAAASKDGISTRTVRIEDALCCGEGASATRVWEGCMQRSGKQKGGSAGQEKEAVWE